MNGKERKVIFSAIIIMIVILIIIAIIKTSELKKEKNEVSSQNQMITNFESGEKYTTKLDDGTKVNNSAELNKIKKYKDIEITDIQFSSKKIDSILTMKVTNTGKDIFKSETIKLKVVDENKKEMASIKLYIEELKIGESRMMSVGVMGDIANAKDIIIEKE